MPDAITIVRQDRLNIAAIVARKKTATRIGDRLGAPLLDRPGWSDAGDWRLIAMGPGHWFALSRGSDPSELTARLSDVASVSDLSSGYVVYRLSGSETRARLQSHVPVDLSPEQFPEGSSARTSIEHISVILWVVRNDAFDMAIPRSFEASFRTWLSRIGGIEQ